MIPYRVHPEANRDGRTAFQSYRSVSTELGARFRAELGVAITFIRRFPEASPEIGEGIHRKLFRRPFPYALWYSVEADGLVIWAIGHQHQEPGFWAERRQGAGPA